MDAIYKSPVWKLKLKAIEVCTFFSQFFNYFFKFFPQDFMLKYKKSRTAHNFQHFIYSSLIFETGFISLYSIGDDKLNINNNNQL